MAAPGRSSGAVGSATPTMWPGPLSIGRGKTWPASSRPSPRCRDSGGAWRPRATWRPRTRKPGCARSITAFGAMTGRLPGSGSPCGRPVSASQPTAGCSACGGYPGWCALSCSMPLAAGCRRRFAPGRATCAATSTGCARQASPPYWTTTCAASTPTATMTTAASPASPPTAFTSPTEMPTPSGARTPGTCGSSAGPATSTSPRFARTGCERWPGPGPAPRWCGCVRSPSCSTACNPSSCSPGCWPVGRVAGRTRLRSAAPTPSGSCCGSARPRPAPAGPTALAGPPASSRIWRSSSGRPATLGYSRTWVRPSPSAAATGAQGGRR